jgi:hypothetical protein
MGTIKCNPAIGYLQVEGKHGDICGYWPQARPFTMYHECCFQSRYGGYPRHHHAKLNSINNPNSYNWSDDKNPNEGIMR